MKTKRIIYFLLIIIGACIMGFGKDYMKKEYALSIGIVLLMFGIYSSSRSWDVGNFPEPDNSEEEDEHF